MQIDLVTLIVGMALGAAAGFAAASVRAAMALAAERTARVAAAAEAVAARQETAALRAAEQVQRDARGAAETAAALARQETAAMRTKISDWEATRAEFLKSTQATVLSTAQQISSKLLEDHKRETEAARLAAEQQVKATTEGLRADVKQITEGVADLKGQVAQKGQQLDTVMRALSSPAGAGYFAEIGLANTLKSFGLVEQRDFILQASMEDEAQRKRPDALVFLPGDGLLVIDAKASKYLLELAEAEGTEREEEAWRALARTMNRHLKDLTDRDYRSAVLAQQRKGGGTATQRLLMLMYLPNEAVLEKLGRADPDFMRKAAAAQITPVGPAGLASLIGFASVEISLQRQVENQRAILDATERLLDALTIAVGHATAVGKGLRGAAENFAKFSGSLNGRLLPRARELTRLGLRPDKQVPGNLASYQVLELGAELIEGEVIAAEDRPVPAIGG